MNTVSDFQSSDPEFLSDWQALSRSESVGLEAERQAIEVGLQHALQRSDEKGLAAFLFRRARNTLNAGDNDEGMKQLRVAIDHAQRTGNRRWEGIGRVFLGLSLPGRGSTVASVRELYHGIDLLHDIVGCEIDYVRAVMEVVGINMRLGLVDEVREYALEMIAFIDEHQLQLVPADFNGIAQTLLGLGELDRAEELYNKTISDTRSNEVRKAYAETGLARIARRRGDNDEALASFQRALARDVTLQARIGITLDFAPFLRSIGRNDEAIRWIDKLLQDPTVDSTTERYGLLLASRAECLIQSDPDRAIEDLLVVTRLHTFDEDPDRQLNHLHMLLELLEQSGDIERGRAIAFDLIRRSIDVQRALRDRSRENLHLLSELNVLQTRSRSRQIVEHLHAERTAAVASITNELDRVVASVKDIVDQAHDLGDVRRDIEVLFRGMLASVNDLHHLETQFRQDHPRFTIVLMQRYPELSPAEQRVCIFLAMGMKSDEIAAVLHRSVRSIENHRLRIRRKLALAPEYSIEQTLREILTQ